MVREFVRIGYQVLNTFIEAKTRRIFAVLGSVEGEGETDSDRAEWMQHVGFASRPAKADPKKQAAWTAVVPGPDGDTVIASQDLRGLDLYGELDFGETCVYAGGVDGTAQGRILLKKDGSVSFFSRAGNSPTGKGMTVNLDAANDTIRLVNSKGFGIVISPDGVAITTGEAAINVESGGDITIVGPGLTQVDGGTVLLGSRGVVGVNSAVAGPTGIAAVASPKVLIALT